MKSSPFETPFYSLLPAIRSEGPDLYIKTSLLKYVANFFSHCRIVHVSKDRKTIEIKVKKWWRWKSPLRIPFSKIDYIDLTYPDLPITDKNDTTEIYDLFLITKNPYNRVDLFRFSGVDSVSLLPQKMAVSCADLIAKLANKRFGSRTPKDMPLADFNDKYICMACGHRLSPESEFILCPYCGGKEIQIV